MEDCRGYDNDHIDRKNLPCIIKCRIKQSISDTHGFTLVELVVVLVIIAVLAAAIGPAFLGYIEKARKNSALNDGKKVYMAVQSLVDQAHADLVDPHVRVTDERITDISGVEFSGGTPQYTIEYDNNTFNVSNPAGAMYSIKKFTYTDGMFTVIYNRKPGGDQDVWTVTDN